MNGRPFSMRQAALGAAGSVAVLFVVAISSLVGSVSAGAVTLSPANGQGSTYAALAFQQWTQDAQLNGLIVNYTATNSPGGLESYANSTADFAGTEAEYSELGLGSSPPARGFEYTPDVAGATAIMYNVALNADGSNPVNYLHLSRLTVAKIFMGLINNWDDPAISADNKGLVLPNKPIAVDCRSGQSGTTALFYDFVAQTDPSDYARWAQGEGFGGGRVLEVDDGQTWHPAVCFNGSDQQAETVASPAGLWSIGYDEFGYAKTYNANVAWIENASGNWVQPFAVNIAAALQSAVLAPDTSQNLDGVYTSTNPLAYPISAYSYILVQCAPTAARPTCATPYSNPGIMNTLSQFMTYVACAGQIKMAEIGYSPLPPQLSQFLANAVGWMTGQPPQTFTAANCSNPQFQGGSLGVGAAPPPDPTKNVQSEGHGPGGTASTATATTSAAGAGAGAAATAANNTGGAATGVADGGTAVGATAAVGRAGAGTLAVGGGSGSWLPSNPAAYHGPTPPSGPPWPLLTLFIVLAIPAVFLSVGRRRIPPDVLDRPDSSPDQTGSP
jgi:phosphate transport system substrate-binding protein